MNVKPHHARLHDVAHVRVSTVDKQTKDGEQPVRLCNYMDVYRNEVIRNDFEFMTATCTSDESSRFRLTPGDVLFTKDSETAVDIGVPAFIESSAEDLVCGYHLAIATPNRSLIEPKFLFWYLSSRPARAWHETRASGVTRVGLRQEDIRHLPVGVLPTMSRQRAIADFLDRETAQIDAMIEAQESMVDILHDRRRAAISDIVDGKASQPRVPLRRLVTSISQGWSPQCEDTPVEDPTSEWAVLKVGCVNGGVFQPQQNKMLPGDVEPRQELSLHAGDLLMSRGNTRELVGSAAVVDKDYPSLMLSDLVYRVTFDQSTIDSQYVALALSTRLARDQIEILAKGASHSMQKITQGDIRSITVPLRSRQEQAAVVAEARTIAAHTDTLITAARRVIELLRERREALITAAVTGKIDPETGIEHREGMS